MMQDRSEKRSVVREEDFPQLLDDYGILRPGTLEPPLRTQAFTVFAQRSDARVEAAAWERHAAQFFGVELRLPFPKRYVFDPPRRDAALVSVTPANRPASTRLCYGRPREKDDLFAADEADLRQGSAGLGRLAQRCAFVWLVEVEVDVEGEGERNDDEPALRLAAILASVVLGPILTPDGETLLGVRSARAKLESLGGPYR
jgi:hypothetical protein